MADNCEAEEEVLDFDPDDWTDPQAAALPNGARDDDVPHHGDGDDQNVKARLNEEQTESVIEHSTRLRSLKQAQDIFQEMGGAMGASLMGIVNRVIHTETKRFTTMMQGDERVVQEMRAGLDAEEAIFHQDRLEHQEHMKQSREKQRVTRDLKEAKTNLQRPTRSNAMPKPW